MDKEHPKIQINSEQPTKEQEEEEKVNLVKRKGTKWTRFFIVPSLIIAFGLGVMFCETVFYLAYRKWYDMLVVNVIVVFVSFVYLGIYAVIVGLYCYYKKDMRFKTGVDKLCKCCKS